MLDLEDTNDKRADVSHLNSTISLIRLHRIYQSGAVSSTLIVAVHYEVKRGCEAERAQRER